MKNSSISIPGVHVSLPKLAPDNKGSKKLSPRLTSSHLNTKLAAHQANHGASAPGTRTVAAVPFLSEYIKAVCLSVCMYVCMYVTSVFQAWAIEKRIIVYVSLVWWVPSESELSGSAQVVHVIMMSPLRLKKHYLNMLA